MTGEDDRTERKINKYFIEAALDLHRSWQNLYHLRTFLNNTGYKKEAKELKLKCDRLKAFEDELDEYEDAFDRLHDIDSTNY